MTSPTFGIFNPYPRTELTEYAKKINVLDKDYNFHTQFGHESPLTNYTAKEKKIQLNIVYLGPIFTKLPDFFRPLFKLLIKMKPNIVFKFIGTTQIVIMTGKNVFPDIYPKSIIKLLQIFYEGVLFWVQKKTTVQ